MQSEWYAAEVSIPTYTLPELLGTKMRALYQRRKGRDLFDLWLAMTKHNVDPNEIIEAWKFYLNKEGNSISQNDFIENIEKKITDKDFLGDMEGLLRPGVNYSIHTALKKIKEDILEKI